MEDLISVIVPVYNTEAYLHKCIESICNQSYKKLEIILVDDGSTDDSGNICDEYSNIDERIKVIHKDNGGLSSARNAGLDIATGKYIGFVDSDDYIHHDMYKTLIQILIQNQVQIAGVSISSIRENEETDSLSHIFKDDVVQVHYISFIAGMLARTADCSVCSKLFEAEVLSKQRFEIGRLNEDGLLMFNILLKQKCRYAYTEQCYYFYLQRQGSICHQGFGGAISDMVDNYLYMEKVITECSLPIVKEANDAVLFACRTYIFHIPEALFTEKDYKTLNVIEQIKKRKTTIMRSDMILRDRIILRLFACAPNLIKKIISQIRERKE